ncbi:uncharacterized protein FOMMEDRAFT_143309 [Fomitiporia mediterranea MF3/22]|uniref:uncharacterized protein n=1 Tax=Fomitiporia mediterranea (strain MF3/22) TaxID=694068 RepID=UPI0004408E2C|nr:uncharacterized protein FOMMEDRAFT_143309 [Fomitiporia mediterranea MF3/22]EJC98216.1 hypothetical protein FOMMEDRAFT_143309 [Fomitiporia mediterranea MF3/22]
MDGNRNPWQQIIDELIRISNAEHNARIQALVNLGERLGHADVDLIRGYVYQVEITRIRSLNLVTIAWPLGRGPPPHLVPLPRPNFQPLPLGLFPPSIAAMHLLNEDQLRVLLELYGLALDGEREHLFQRFLS